MGKMDLELEIIFDGSDVEKSMTDGEVADHPADELFEKARFGTPTAGGVDPQLLDQILGKRELDKADAISDFAWDTPLTNTQLEKTVPTPKHLPTDGTCVEIIGRQRWSYTTVNGKIAHIRLDDPDMTPPTMHFDRDGNETQVAA